MKQQLEACLQDLRYGIRGLLRAPLFTAVAIFAIALGTGASAAVFSVVDRILFRSLPYPQYARLVSLGMTAPIAPQEFLLAYDYLDWRDAQTPFTSIGSWSGSGDCDLNDANPVRLPCARADAAFLPTLGAQPLLGRTFTGAEDRPNAPRVALISHALWRSRFGADPNVTGRTVPLDGRPVTIIGVLPKGFEMPDLAPADLLLPQALDEAEQRSRRSASLLWVVGRLKPGVATPQAAAALQPLFDRSMKDVPPGFRKEVKLRVRPLRDRQTQDSRLASWILLASVLSVLLIACANVANLLLVRSAGRRRELAVRAAIGAGQARLVRQTLTESLLLALVGGAAGCGLAFLLLRLFTTIAPEGIPRLANAGLDLRVLAFTLGATTLCGVLFGLAPALETPRAEMLAGWRTVGGRSQRFRQGLVATQICVSLILLAGASLLLRSLWNLQNQPLGMRTDSVMTAALTLGRQSYPDAVRRAAFFEELESRLKRIPGVAGVAVTSSLPPVSGTASSTLYATIDVQGRPRTAGGTGGMVTWRLITPDYFSTLGIPILRGRGFTNEDRDPNANVVILSDSLARRMFPGEDPLGKQIQPGRSGPFRRVIGIAANVKNKGLAERDEPEYYEIRKHAAANIGAGAVALVRTPMDQRAMAAWIRREVVALDATLPVKIESMDQQIGRLASRPRFNALLLGNFAGMGLLLAAIGAYGVVSFQVGQRTQEIGVRVALGATPSAISRMVLLDAARWIAAGAVLGVIGSLLAFRLIEAMLFGLSARDPLSLAFAVAILGGAGLVAAWLPARRAASIDPMEALRRE